MALITATAMITNPPYTTMRVRVSVVVALMTMTVPSGHTLHNSMYSIGLKRYIIWNMDSSAGNSLAKLMAAIPIENRKAPTRRDATAINMIALTFAEAVFVASSLETVFVASSLEAVFVASSLPNDGSDPWL